MWQSHLQTYAGGGRVWLTLGLFGREGLLAEAVQGGLRSVQGELEASARATYM